MDIYNDLDLHFNDLKNVGNWPQDLLDVKLKHADFSGDRPDLPEYVNISAVGDARHIWDANGTWEWVDIDSNKQTDANLALCYAYKTVTDTEGVFGIKVIAVPIADYLSSATDGNGLETENGVTSVKVKDGEPYIAVTDEGLQTTDALAEALEAAAEASNVTWDKVMISVPVGGNPVKCYYNIGNVKGSLTKPVTLVDENQTKSVQDIFLRMFAATRVQPNNPTAPEFKSIAVTVPTEVYIGDIIDSVKITPNTTKGSYQFGPEVQGVNWSFALNNSTDGWYDADDGQDHNGLTLTNGSYTIDLKKNYVVGLSSNIQIAMVGAHTAASNVAKDNLDETSSPEKRISAGSGINQSASFGVSDYYRPVFVVMADADMDVDDIKDMIEAEGAKANVNTSFQLGKVTVVWGKNSTQKVFHQNSGTDAVYTTTDVNPKYSLWIVTNKGWSVDQSNGLIQPMKSTAEDTKTIAWKNGTSFSYSFYKSNKVFSSLEAHTEGTHKFNITLNF